MAVSVKDVPLRRFAEVHGGILARRAERAGLAPAMARELAAECLEELRQALGGSRVYVPRLAARNAELARKVAKLSDAGLTMKDVAARLGITRAHAYRVRARSRRQA